MRHPQPRCFVCSLFLLFAALLHPLPGLAADVPDELVVADQKGQQRALMEAAGVEQDLPFRVRWVEFEAASPLLQALGAGAVDTGIAGDGPFFFAWGAGMPVKAAYLIPPRGGGHATAIVVAPGSTITSPAQLSGKRIATGRGSIGHLLLLRLIATGGIPAPAPQIVFLQPAQAKAALDTGRVDAWSTWEPYIALETIGHKGHIVVDAAGLTPNNSFFVATTAALAQKRRLLATFYQRVALAYAWGQAHQAQYAHILAQQTGLPEDVAVSVARQLIASPVPISDAVEQAELITLDTYRNAGLIQPSAPLSEAFDKDILKP
ncbi:alkane sulfonate ABC transporter substrate-bindnig protein [Komagataeibacter sucrofermentans]|uniref:Putative aliphatic sulfonates-binding protein n=1 Tax=Komagataeibacter sucrofermentans TaxID=1053551 RepID=A0A318QHR4_9PROT|nr:alkane sulfonate ABC transporter substrate-bindnig protein [Komagataeibacter sucrofermentans]